MHMYDARKNVRENRAITHILKGEMRFATETSLVEKPPRFEKESDNTSDVSLIGHTRRPKLGGSLPVLVLI
jgi:hypothetical protein